MIDGFDKEEQVMLLDTLQAVNAALHLTPAEMSVISDAMTKLMEYSRDKRRKQQIDRERIVEYEAIKDISSFK